MKLLYVYKKPKSINWSNVLAEQGRILAQQPDCELIEFEIDTGSVSAYFSNRKRLEAVLNGRSVDIIMVHHIICSWPLLPWIRKFSGTKILMLHEAEPVLGYGFLFSNFFKIPIKHWIRYNRFWNSKPLSAFDRVVVLSDGQRVFKRYQKRYHQINFLGVDANGFQPMDKHEQHVPIVFFPFGPERIEKGFENFAEVLGKFGSEVDPKVGGDIPFESMPEVFRSVDILFLPGTYETYSLVILEAMASDNFILVNENVGIIQNLLKDRSLEKLREYGIYPVSDGKKGYEKFLREILDRIKTGKIARTRSLFEEEELDIVSATKKLWEYSKNLIRG